MPISSYLAIPKANQLPELTKQVEAFSECETLPSSNKEVLVVTTDTIDAQAEERLIQKIQSLDSLQQMTMVSGYNDKK